MLYAMHTSGADTILALGGVQALAALVYGIEGLAPSDLIVGAGNAYVAEAKRHVTSGAVLSPDGRALYAAGFAGLGVIDTASLTSRRDAACSPT